MNGYSDKPRVTPAVRRQGGLTLLELLLVVFILAALAVAAATVTEGLDGQVRYDDTTTRLAKIRRAIVGDDRSTAENTRRLSGFVVDNGLLPGSEDTTLTVLELLSVPSGWATFDLQEPRFDPDPDAEGYDNGGATTDLDGAAEKLLKGYRRASYLLTEVDTSEFKDGWSNDWTYEPSGAVGAFDERTIRSLGADGVSGDSGLSDHDADTDMNVRPNEWSVPLDGLAVRVVNQTGAAWTPASPVRVSILVFENGPVETGRWRRWTASDSLIAIAEDDSALIVFDGGAAPSGVGGRRLPVGEHLLVLVSDLDAAPHTSDDAPFVDGGGSRVTARLRIYAGALLPEVRLVVRTP